MNAGLEYHNTCWGKGASKAECSQYMAQEDTGEDDEAPPEIAKHPSQWSRNDVSIWVQWCRKEFSLVTNANEHICPFEMNGKALLLLTKDDFEKRMTGCGDVLYNNLRSMLNAEREQPSLKKPEEVLPRSPVTPQGTHFTMGAATKGPRFGVPTHIISMSPGAQIRSANRESKLDNSTVMARTPRTEFFPIYQQGTPTGNLHYASSLPHPSSRDQPAPLLFAAQQMRSSTNSHYRLPISSAQGAANNPGKRGLPTTPDQTVESSPKALKVTTVGVRVPDLGPSSTSPAPTGSGPSLPISPEGSNSSGEPTEGFETKRIGQCGLLWEFIRNLLADERYEFCIEWLDREELIFRIVNPEGLAKLWGLQKNRDNMTYEKMSRALRYYYRSGIMKKVPQKKLIYQFLIHPDQIPKLPRGLRQSVKMEVQHTRTDPCRQYPSPTNTWNLTPSYTTPPTQSPTLHDMKRIVDGSQVAAVDLRVSSPPIGSVKIEETPFPDPCLHSNPLGTWHQASSFETTGESSSCDVNANKCGRAGDSTSQISQSPLEFKYEIEMDTADQATAIDLRVNTS